MQSCSSYDKVSGYVQAKKSKKVIRVPLVTNKVPLYGAATNIGADPSNHIIVLSAQISICSHYYILGQMLKSKFCTRISCTNLHVNSHTMTLITPLKNACSS